ncbi:MAG: acyl carrier protein [candidate division Zixibacteria bacterium]|nr:acyl carrier protein [candidate division Zixibacteria bacterium]
MPALKENTARSDLKEFIIDSFMFGQKEQTFSDSDSFMERGIVDSTGILELTSFVEEKYKFEIEDDEMIPENLDSIDNLIKYITKKLS